MRSTQVNPTFKRQRVVLRRPLHLTLVLFMAWALSGHAIHADDVLETPPLGPVRQPAEFEPVTALLIEPIGKEGTRLPFEFLVDAAEEVDLVVPYKDEEDRIRTEEQFSLHGVNLDNCVFYEATGLVGQARDLPPWFVFNGHGEPAFALSRPVPPPGKDPIFGQPMYGLEQGYPVHRTGLKIDGGNYMTDGRGIAVSTDRVYTRNSDLLSEIPERVRDFLGVHTYHVIPDAYRAIPGMSMEHVDCFTKFLSPDTIMVLEYPSTDPDYQNLEDTADYFRRQVSCYGTPYRVVRVFAPYEMPYANALILNHKVYVPVNGTEWDAGALASYGAAMPGYQVIGQLWTWRPSDALHCRTMGIPDEHMLYIEHVPVLDRPSASEGFPVTARIVAHSRTDFEEGTPVVFWRTLADANDSQLELESPALWDTAPMTLQPESEAHQYLAHIPTQPVGTVIQYYLQARDGSGRNETHPYIGEAQAHTFTVTALGANVSAVSAQRGGAIEIYLNLGPANAQQAYRLMYSIQSSDTDSQGLVLPETTVLTGFEGALDDLGIGAARMAIAGPLTSDWSGRSLRFSLELADQQNTVVGAVDIQILD